MLLVIKIKISKSKMGFVFNPLLWFVCRSCRQAFADTDKLKKHKLENHLGDCLRIKTIIFEERHVEQELTSIKDEIHWSTNSINECNTVLYENPPDTEIRTRTQSNKSLPNPYISIKKLTPHEVRQALNENCKNKGLSAKSSSSRKSTRCGSKTHSNSQVPLLAVDVHKPFLKKLKNLNTRRTPTHDTGSILSSPEHKQNKPIFLEQGTPVHTVSTLSPEQNFQGHKVDTNLCKRSSNCQEVEDREFIVASIVKGPDGMENIQFESALIPTSPQEFSRLKKNKVYTTIFDNDSDVNVNMNIPNHDIPAQYRSETTSLIQASNSTSENITLNTEGQSVAEIKFEVPTANLVDSVPNNNILPTDQKEEEKLLGRDESDDHLGNFFPTVSDTDSTDCFATETDVTEPSDLIHDGCSTEDLALQSQIIGSSDRETTRPKSLNISFEGDYSLNYISTIETESRSRYSFRRKKSQINYSETQLCKGCNKDFYIVEDLVEHEKVCLSRKNSRSIAKPTLTPKVVSGKIVCPDNTGDIPMLDKTLLNDCGNNNQDIRVNEIASTSAFDSSTAKDKVVVLVRETKNDDDYVCPVTDDSGSVMEIDDNDEDDIFRRKTRNSGVSGVKSNEGSKHKLKKAKNRFTADNTTLPWREDPEYYGDEYLLSLAASDHDDNLPFNDWLNFQKQIIASGQSTNIVLLENDPTVLSPSSSASQSENPIVCKLCHLKLNFPSEKKIRNHIENCWFHNKLKHRYCVECDFGFENVILLKRHKKYDHVEEQLTTMPAKRSEENDEPNEGDEDSNESDFEYDLNALPLGPWLKKRIENLEQRHKQNKSKSELIVLDPDPADKNYENIVVNRKTRLTCKLCGLIFKAEVRVRKHVRNCWRLNKQEHQYCIPCRKPFFNTGGLNRHNYCQHTAGPKFPFFCVDCCTGFIDVELYKQHVYSRNRFKSHMNSQVYVGNTDDSKCSNSNEVEVNNTLKSNLGQWLKDQKEKNPANIILLEPNPITENFGPISNLNAVKCKLCLRSFTSERVLKSHVSMCWFHNKRIHRYCVKCNKSKFKSCNDFKEHNYRKHSKVSRIKFKCKECGKEFKTPRMFKFHEKTHKMPEEVVKPFKCEICGAHFRYITNLNIHLVSHKEDRPVKCPHCPATWKCESALARHLITHGKKTGHVCKFCSRMFTLKNLLDDHERTHTGDKPYKCQAENCQYAFPSSASLTMHTRIKHGKELGLTQYLCPTCGKVFGLQSHLNYHIRRFHTEAADKPFKCPEEGCSRTFSMKEQLISHGRVHTGEKPYQCDKCGNSFAQAQTFRKHQKKHEENSNEVVCDLCPKKFPGMTELKRHLKRHDISAEKEMDKEKKTKKKRKRNKKKFTCDLCGLECSTKLSLKKHEKTHEDNLSDDKTDNESMGSMTTESD